MQIASQVLVHKRRNTIRVWFYKYWQQRKQIKLSFPILSHTLTHTHHTAPHNRIARTLVQQHRDYAVSSCVHTTLSCANLLCARVYVVCLCAMYKCMCAPTHSIRTTHSTHITARTRWDAPFYKWRLYLIESVRNISCCRRRRRSAPRSLYT